MAEIAVIQLQDDAPPGLLVPWAARRGLALRVWRPDRGERPPAAVGAAIVLGSDKSVNDEAIAWNAPLRAWASDVLGASAPMLGICFGAQLMARAAGATVVRMAAPEIGWVAVSEEIDGVSRGPWLEWHSDAIVPGDGLRVVSSNARGVQAFRLGADGSQLGVQFHPEVTPQIVADWGRIGDAGALAAAGTSAEELERASRCHERAAAQAAFTLFHRWAAAAGLR